MFRLPATILLLCACISVCLGQDSAKRVNTAGAKKYATFKRPYKYRLPRAAPDTAGPLKPDTSATLPVIDKGLNGQFQYLLTKVYHYQQPLISAMWKNASDTLQLTRKKLKTAQDSITIKNKVIDSLNTELGTQQQTTVKSSQIQFFGIYFSKSVYNSIVWGLIIVLALSTFIVFAQSGSSRREAKYRTKLYSELEEEFKTFKAKANDKERKLARELQTERNKVDELQGKK